MANHSLKAAVKRQHCSLRLTVCTVRKEREKGQDTSKTCAARPRKAATHTGCFLCCCATRTDVALSSSNLPQPSQSLQPPVATQSQPQSDSNRKGKERAPSSQPKPLMWQWGIVRNMCVLC